MQLKILGFILLAMGWLGGASFARAQAVEVTDETSTQTKGAESRPAVGKDAARKYFKVRKTEAEESQSTMKATVAGERYMAIQLGTFLSEDVYKWGHGPYKHVGQLNFDVTYKLGEWTGSMDLLFKGDVTTYSLNEGRATKLTLMPAIAFPDSASGFPLYFGAGAGLGIFFNQIPDESSLAFDYSIFGGARVFDVFNTVGLIAEVGIKNHILLLSDGQYNGVFATFGTVFHF